MRYTVPERGNVQIENAGMRDELIRGIQRAIFALIRESAARNGYHIRPIQHRISGATPRDQIDPIACSLPGKIDVPPTIGEFYRNVERVDYCITVYFDLTHAQENTVERIRIGKLLSEIVMDVPVRERPRWVSQHRDDASLVVSLRQGVLILVSGRDEIGVLDRKSVV